MKDSAKLFHICAYYPPHIGGLERVAKEIAEQLSRDGTQVTVLTTNIHSAQHSPEQTHPLLHVQRLWSFEFAHTPIIPTLLWHLLRAPRRSIFHLHLAQAYVSEMVWFASKIRRIPYVVHYHLDVERSGRFGFMFDRWKRYILPRIMKDAAHIITLSTDQQLLIRRRYGIPENRVSIVPNGVSANLLMSAVERNTVHDPIRLLYVGRLAVQKRVERLIEAMPLVTSPVSLTIVGDGEDRRKLEALTNSHDLRNVIFRGPFLDEALQTAYREADIFVIASDKEGMPLAIMEAMAAGLPIIGSDVLGVNELVRGVGVLVSDPSAETFASAINDIVRDPERLRGLHRASLDKARGFSWEHSVHQIEALYREIAP